MILITTSEKKNSKWKFYILYEEYTSKILQNHFNQTYLAHNLHTRKDSTHEHHQMVNTEIWLIIFFSAKDGEALFSHQKQDQELIVAQIMNSLLPNSDLNWRK